ncbi:unnamed protein product [Calicophoron daubneyi]|uniref:Transcription factor CBF/NF-Y/archaeal histone domain-containing protein n=1 Tax=Calicophoron daubneyi TaxID=300641 RepID=A0AAV2TWF0_CALDB
MKGTTTQPTEEISADANQSLFTSGALCPSIAEDPDKSVPENAEIPEFSEAEGEGSKPEKLEAPCPSIFGNSERTDFEHRELSETPGIEDAGSSLIQEKILRLPMSRVKTIVKTVPSVHLVHSETLVLIEHATLCFLRDFCHDVCRAAVEEGKKTVARPHVDAAVRHLAQYEFLEGMLD